MGEIIVLLRFAKDIPGEYDSKNLFFLANKMNSIFKCIVFFHKQNGLLKSSGMYFIKWRAVTQDVTVTPYSL